MLNTGGSHFLIQRKSDMNALFTKKGKAGLLQLRWYDIPTTLQLIACMHACSVGQLCLILCNPMDCSPPGSSVHGILQARILE